MNEQRISLCEKIAKIEDELKPDFFRQAELFADVFPQQTIPSWQCSLPKAVKRDKENFITVRFETGEVVIKQSRVLIVEDDGGLRESLKLVIETEANVVVTVASDGHSAINLLKNNTFDIVFLDIKLPDIIGFEVLKFSKFKHPETKVYMVSAYTAHEYISQADDLYADGFIPKPFEPERIMEIINS